MTCKEAKLGTWQEEFADGNRMLREARGEPEVSDEERRGVTLVLSMLSESDSYDELQKYYRTKRNILTNAIWSSALESLHTPAEIRRVLKMAFALRIIEIWSGKTTTNLDWETSPPFDHAVLHALSEMVELAVRSRHQRITIHHLLCALMNVPQIKRHDSRFSDLARETAEHVRGLRATPIEQYRVPGDLEEDVKQVLGVATEEAQRRGLVRIRPALVIYAILRTHVSELQHLMSRTFGVHDLEAAIEQLLRPEAYAS